MIWFVYNILFPIGFLLLLPKFLIRMCRRGGYAADFMQRFGVYDPKVRMRLCEGGRIWVQAVSVGEIFVALRFIEEIRASYPNARFVLSTNTSTGYSIGKKNIDDRDVLIYFPLDFPFIMTRVFRMLKPGLVLLIENEMWPNMIRCAKRNAIPVVLVNGRISAHSYNGYCRLRPFTTRLLPLVDLFCAQSQEDAGRLISLGARKESLQVMGSAKYDVITSDESGELQAVSVLRQAGYDQKMCLIMGGSTWPGEEEILLGIFKRIRVKHPSAGLLLAPRHVERLDDVLEAITCLGLTYVRRSEIGQDVVDGVPDVFVLDTTGELKNYYAQADIIFVGRSLTQHGGQNPIEPAYYGRPVLVGPNMENFPGVMEDFLKANAVIQVANESELERCIEQLLDEPAVREKWGASAAELVKEKAGAASATVQCITDAGFLK